MKDDVKIMTDVFKNAMIFEKYKKLWSDALKHVDSLLENNKRKSQKALAGIEEEEYIIATAKHMNEVYIENAQKDIKKYRRIILLLISVIVIFLIAFLVLFMLNLREALVMLFMVSSPFFVGIGPIVFLGITIYCLYNIHKRKIDIKKLTSQNVNNQITTATKNIESYNFFLQKTKSEQAYLLTKKQAILTELNKAKDTLDQIYSYDLIPKKYQGLVQVATIYGYLYNGICTNIRGHGGVYDRYENDLILGAIIAKLDEISNKLDIVIKNQQELLETLKSIDITLSGIRREVEHSNELLSDIRTSSAIGAAAAQQSVAYQEYVATAVWSSL